jgi:hypothetical protein
MAPGHTHALHESEAVSPVLQIYKNTNWSIQMTESTMGCRSSITVTLSANLSIRLGCFFGLFSIFH